jgi:hypothetical protein
LAEIEIEREKERTKQLQIQLDMMRLGGNPSEMNLTSPKHEGFMSGISGLFKRKSSLSSGSNTRKENDPIATWIEENLVADPSGAVNRAHIWTAFTAIRSQRHISQKALWKGLQDFFGCSPKKESLLNYNIGWLGFRLRTEE